MLGTRSRTSFSQWKLETLGTADRTRYIFRFMEAASQALEDDSDQARQLEFIGHYFDIAERVMSPADYDRLLRTPLWSAAWENSERLREVLQQARDRPDVSEEERAELEARLEIVEGLIRHKQDIDDLPG